MRGALILSMSLTLLAAACGDDDAVTTTAPAPTTTTTTTTAPDTATTEAPTTTTEPPPPPPPLADVSFRLVEVASGFRQPAYATGRPGDDALYVVDQVGRLFAVPADGEERLVLDLSSRTLFRGEQGLLGVAFHPGDPARLFVHYSRAGDGATVVEEYRLPLEAAAADPEPVRQVLTVSQPAGNHNGGMIDFGPDGMLYIALGDGGAANDRFRNGQDPFTLLGTILRLDVDGGDPYAIPADNPFADGRDGAPEVWAYGLRNPWRFSFDGEDLWIADVGQGDWEEINLVGIDDGGANFGWPILEGTDCFEGPPSLCEDNDFVDPTFQYTIRGVGRCAIMGGYVYRGASVPALFGAYLFADWCSGEIMALRVESGAVVDDHVFDRIGERITSFGTDVAGELYVVSERAVYRIEG